jgi:hypothetical protein
LVPASHCCWRFQWPDVYLEFNENLTVINEDEDDFHSEILDNAVFEMWFIMCYVSRYGQNYVQKTCLFHQSRDLFLFSSS